jgi:TM2 domain-containing membrane protein YozV
MPFCPQCGTNNPETARFCQSCGGAIPVVAPQAAPQRGAAPPPPPPPVYGAPVYPPHGPAVTTRRKSPGAACALGLFWGFGAQAFYNGQPLKAVVQIILNLLIMWPMLQFMGGGGAWFVGLGVAVVFMADGYKIAQKINAGIPVGPWTFF